MKTALAVLFIPVLLFFLVGMAAVVYVIAAASVSVMFNIQGQPWWLSWWIWVPIIALAKLVILAKAAK